MSRINRAIILAAGQGTRLRPLTNDRPKCLVEYQGIPILERLRTTFAACSISDLTLVAGYLAHTIPAQGLNVLRNPRFAETNMVHTLMRARDILRRGAVVCYGDILFRPRVLQAVLDSPHDFAVCVDTYWQELWQRRMEDPLADAETLKLSPDGRILELGKKPNSYEDIQGQYMGLFAVSPGAASKILDLYDSLDRTALYDGKDFENMYMTSFIQAVIDHCMDVHAVPVSGGWLEIDTPSDLDVDMVEP